MFAVEIRLSDDRLLIECMTKVSEWLRNRCISPETFRYIFQSPGVVFRVDFKRASEAVAFAAKFSGHIATYAADRSRAVAHRDLPPVLSSAAPSPTGPDLSLSSVEAHRRS